MAKRPRRCDFSVWSSWHAANSILRLRPIPTLSEAQRKGLARQSFTARRALLRLTSEVERDRQFPFTKMNSKTQNPTHSQLLLLSHIPPPVIHRDLSPKLQIITFVSKGAFPTAFSNPSIPTPCLLEENIQTENVSFKV